MEQMQNLSSFVTLRVVIETTFDAASDDKVGIITTSGAFSHGEVGIMANFGFSDFKAATIVLTTYRVFSLANLDLSFVQHHSVFVEYLQLPWRVQSEEEKYAYNALTVRLYAEYTSLWR